MVSEMKSPLAVQGLCKNYPAFTLQDVSFSLVPGSITGMVSVPRRASISAAVVRSR